MTVLPSIHGLISMVPWPVSRVSLTNGRWLWAAAPVVAGEATKLSDAMAAKFGWKKWPRCSGRGQTERFQSKKSGNPWMKPWSFDAGIIFRDLGQRRLVVTGKNIGMAVFCSCWSWEPPNSMIAQGVFWDFSFCWLHGLSFAGACSASHTGGLFEYFGVHCIHWLASYCSDHLKISSRWWN